MNVLQLFLFLPSLLVRNNCFTQSMGLCEFDVMFLSSKNLNCFKFVTSIEDDKNTFDNHTTEATARTEVIESTKSDVPTEYIHTSKHKTAREGIQTTKEAPVTTYIENIEEFYTTTEVHTTKQTTSDTTTRVSSTKATTYLMRSCPENMIYMTCACETTCEEPGVCSNNSCDVGDTCVCPDGFFLMGEDCVPPERCDCYFAAEDVIFEEGSAQVVSDCEMQCSCTNGLLSCDDYQCDPNAACNNINGSLQCSCNDGYYGDGVICTRLTDCESVYNAGFEEEGVYTILPMDWPGLPFQVYCKEGWTVFQRREDGSEEFYRGWDDYKVGFGDLRGEMWLGLEKLHYLTSQGFYQLKISLESDGTPYEIKHSQFEIDNEGNDYALKELGSYSGNIGYDYLSYHRTWGFTTLDRDNDKHNTDNCAENGHGAWWYVSCYNVNLNGRYDDQTTEGLCLYKRDVKVHYCNIPSTEMSVKHV